MKIDAFEKMIRKIVREEIEYSMEKLISGNPKNESVSKSTESNKQSLDEIRRSLKSQYGTLNNDDLSNTEYDDAPDYLKNALTRDYTELLNRFNK